MMKLNYIIDTNSCYNDFMNVYGTSNLRKSNTVTQYVYDNACPKQYLYL